jgi:EF hand
MIPVSLVQAQSSTSDSRANRSDDSSGHEEDDRGERRDSWRSRLRDRQSERDRESRGARDRDEGDTDREESSGRGTSATASEAPRPSTTTNNSTTNMDARAWATSLVKKHDKNGNMILEPEEQGGLGGSVAASDLDKDGKITIDELLMRSSASTPAAAPTTSDSLSTKDQSMEQRGGKSPGGSRERVRDSGGGQPRGDLLGAAAQRVFTGSAGGVQPGDGEKNNRRSYRFTPPADRLPKGLPSFFSRDANGDGQVSMHEYGRTWSSRMVAEFRRYDLNDDGIITPKEAVK